MKVEQLTQAASSGGEGGGSVVGGGTNTIFRFFLKDAEPPPTNFGRVDSRNSHPIADFSPSTAETLYFREYIPQGTTFHSSSIALTIYIDALATSATSGVIGWSVSLERITPNGIDLDADAFGTAKSAQTTVNVTSGKMARVTVQFLLSELPFGIAAGDMLRVRLTRDTTVGSNHSGDAEFVGMYGDVTPAPAP